MPLTIQDQARLITLCGVGARIGPDELQSSAARIGEDPRIGPPHAITIIHRKAIAFLMQLRWTEEAANDLERIADYLLTHAPDRAPELVHAVYEHCLPCSHFRAPAAQGKKDGTRELVLSLLPYLVVYKVHRTDLCRAHTARSSEVALGAWARRLSKRSILACVCS